uniref:VWFA domain-containing protein n=1 Tax=Echinostoma caproni TaxID=27848 RepID=A0A183ADW1_9TREM
LLRDERRLKRCLRHGELEIKHLFWTLQGHSCIPGMALYTVNIPCTPEVRERITPCQVEPSGIGKFRVDRLERRIVGCQKRSLEPCCCPRPQVQPVYCDPVRNILTQRETTYQLQRADRGSQRAVAFCRAFNQDKTVPVYCGPRHHRIRIRPCDGQFHLVSVQEPIVKNCECKQSRARHFRIRCGCPNQIQHVKGTCGEDLWAEDKWIGLRAVPVPRPPGLRSTDLRMNPVKCEPVVLEARRRRCGCPAPEESTICMDGKLLVRQRISHQLNSELNTCERHVMRSPSPVRCPLARLLRSKCSPQTQFIQNEIMRYWVVDQCQCRPVVKKRSWICDCTARYPAREREFCHPNGQLKVFERTRWINVGKHCKRLVEKREEPVVCSNQLKMIRGVCDRDIPNRRRVFWLQQRPRRCQCEWHRLTDTAAKARGLRVTEACRCGPEHLIKQCEPASPNKPALLRIIHEQQAIVNGECKPRQRIEMQPVVCGPSEEVINGPCDPIAHTRLVKRVRNRMEKCECRKTVSEHRCACSCPKVKYHALCHPQEGLFRLFRVEHKFDPQGCLCLVRRRVRQRIVQCPEEKRLIAEGPCQTREIDKFSRSTDEVIRPGDRFRHVTWLVSERDGCHCKRRRLVTEELCVLGKVETIARCNRETGIEHVTQLIPYSVQCQRRVQVQTALRRCSITAHLPSYSIPPYLVPHSATECQSQPRLVRKTKCGSDCVEHLFWSREVLTPEGQCKRQMRSERVVCCCPRPLAIPERCDPVKGVLVSGMRVFELHTGKCVPRDQLAPKPIACPPPTTRKQCIHSGPDQFSVQHISIRWFPLAGADGTCSRQDTLIDQQPVDCSASQLIRATECQPDEQRHALVRIDRVFSTSPEGCRCVPNPPKLIYHVCQCAKPEQKIKCNPSQPAQQLVVYTGRSGAIHAFSDNREGRTVALCSRGLLMQLSTQYELSGDRTRCLPHTTRRVWKVACPFSGHPEHKGRTPCDPQTGLYFELYEQHHRHGCRCEVKRWKVPGRCRCPKPVVRTRCLDHTTREVITTVSRLTPKGICIHSDVTHKEPIHCPTPHRLLRADPKYQIERDHDSTSPVPIRHVYPCGSAGHCQQSVREFAWSTDAECGCRWKMRLVKRACCCPRDQIERVCNRQKGVAVYRKTEWHLQDGHCRPTTHAHAKPLACEKEIIVKPIEMCHEGKQKHLLIQPFQESCACNYRRKVIVKPCLCPVVSAAEVIFMIDAAVIKRQPDYLEHVQRMMHTTIHAFTLSAASREQGNSHRFAIVVYAHHPELLYNLEERHDPAQILDQIDRITLVDTHGSNLGAALALVEREVLPHQRPKIPVLLYVITDGVEVSWPDALHVARVLRDMGARLTMVHIGPLTGPAEAHWLTQFVSPPPSIHLIDLPRAAALKDRIGQLIETMCTRACPPDQIHEAPCGPPTGCLGRTYIQSYRFDTKTGHCVGQTKIRQRRCCCTQRPKDREICVGNRLYHYSLIWRMDKHGTCTQHTVKRDITANVQQICPKPFIVKSACDTMTCQRRLTLIEHVPQQCVCQRRAKIRYETCCCRGERTINYEGCKYEALKMFVERTIEPTVKAECPRNPKTIRHQCRHAVERDKLAPDSVDPALIYRQVEHVWWQIGACECRLQRRSHFEACGCDQSMLGSNLPADLNRCHVPSGILIKYTRRLRLEVAGRVPEHEIGTRLLNLQEAKCQPEFKVQSVRKIVCPDAKISTGACVRAQDGRSYRSVYVHRWFRQGCQCVSAQPELKQRVICACVPKWGMKRCTASRPGAVRDRLEFRLLQEQLVSRPTGPNGKLEPTCVPMLPIERVHITTCPKNQVKYSECENGKVHITVVVFMVHNCRCIHRERHLIAKCQLRPTAGAIGQLNPTRGATRPGQKPDYGLVMPVYRLVECIDLLPTSQCRFLERPPHGICEKVGEGQDMLCRRTCNQCSRCPLDQITFRIVQQNGPGGACIMSNRHYEGKYLHRVLRGPVTLAHCKLVCARHSGCLSIDYYVTERRGAPGAVCVLNRVDPATLRVRWPDPVVLGASQKELERIGAARCFLFRKVCKQMCPKPQTELLSPCKCEQLEQAVDELDVEDPRGKSVTHCAKRVRVLFYAQTPSGYCVRKQWIGTVPCPNPDRKMHFVGPEGDCEDKQPPLWCQDRLASANNACHDPKLRAVSASGVCVWGLNATSCYTEVVRVVTKNSLVPPPLSATQEHMNG